MKEEFTKLGEEHVPKLPTNIIGNSGSSRLAQQTQPEQQTSPKHHFAAPVLTLPQPAESTNPPRQERPNSSKSSFWMSKGSSNLKVIFLRSKIWGSSLTAFLLYVQLMCKGQRQGAACSLGPRAGFCKACSCPGTPRWGQSLHLPSGKAVAITSVSTLDILPADSQPACKNNCQRELFQ